MSEPALSVSHSPDVLGTAAETAAFVVRFLDDKKLLNTVAFDLRAQGTYCDFLIVASGTSDRHVKTAAEQLWTEAKHRGLQPHGMEGLRSAQWVLVDLVEVVVHIFYEPVRAQYDIEGLWHGAPRLDVYAVVHGAEPGPVPSTTVAIAGASRPPVRPLTVEPASSDDPGLGDDHPLVRRRRAVAAGLRPPRPAPTEPAGYDIDPDDDETGVGD